MKPKKRKYSLRLLGLNPVVNNKDGPKHERKKEQQRRRKQDERRRRSNDEEYLAKR
jgi:hypothetical protein